MTNSSTDDHKPCCDGAPSPPTSPALQHFWHDCFHKVATLPEREPLAAGMKERHRLYSLLLMAIVARYWNGNKYGAEGIYPFREGQRLYGVDGEEGIYRGCEMKPRDGEASPGRQFDYLGHNIACIAVDGRGEVIDFDFNHNEVLDSSVEHAESRLVRRVFSLAQLYDTWQVGSGEAKAKGREYSNILSDVTVYTSLESCAQCAGIMALGKVKEVVYLQTDPGMYSIGNLLYNLTHFAPDAGLPSPLPVPGSAFDLDYFTRLDEGYQEWRPQVKEKGFFFKKGLKADHRDSITSFLCTDKALEIYAAGRKEYEELTAARLASPDYPFKPGEAPPQPASERKGPLTNAEVLANTRAFYEYAIGAGERGTAHKL